MPPALGTDPTLGTTKSIGRYFGVVSTLPTVLFIGWLYVLLAAGAWNGPPNIPTLQSHSPWREPSASAAALVVAIAIAVVSHPAQFLIVQLLEGYWGASRLGRALHDRATFRQLRLKSRSEALRAEATVLKSGRLPEGHVTSRLLSPKQLRDDPRISRHVITWQNMRDTARVIDSRYPDEELDIMPTRLGNILRRHELIAGRAVGLPVLDWATYIGMVAAPEHGAYVADQRTQLDLAARISALAGIATAITFGLLWDKNGAALLALAPFGAMLVSYRGALSAADSYGIALRAWVDLNRFRLYDELGLQDVDSAAEERERNEVLEDMLRGDRDFDIPLRRTHERSAPDSALH